MFKTNIRLDELTAIKLKAVAKRNHRSMNGQIQFIIEKYLDDYEKFNGNIKIEPEDELTDTDNN